jgi:hypothetical protein
MLCQVDTGHQQETRDLARSYPPFVCTENERRRWDLAAQIVEMVFRRPRPCRLPDGHRRDLSEGLAVRRSLGRSPLPRSEVCFQSAAFRPKRYL